MSAGAMEGLAAGASTPDLDSSAQLALDAIVTLTNGGYGRAAMRAIATEAGLSVPTVSKAVKRLETMGLLVAQRPAGAGRSTVYEVAENARSNYTRRGPVSEGLPDCFRSHDFVRPGWLWAAAPKGVPLRLKAVHQHALVKSESTTERHLKALSDLPCPAVTRAKDPSAPRFHLYTFWDLSEHEQARNQKHLTDRLKKWRPKTKLQREAEHEAERQALRDKYGEAAYADLAPKIIALSVEGGPGLYSRRKHTPCWMYGGELSADHYGVVDGVRSPAIRAHRITYYAARGPIPPGRELHHLCDTPACVNPAHLFPLWPAEHARITAMSQYTRQLKKNLAKFGFCSAAREAADAKAHATFTRRTTLATPIGTPRPTAA